MRKLIIFIFFQCMMFIHHGVYAQKDYRVRSIHYAGNNILANDKLEEQLNTSARKKLHSLLFWKKHAEFSLSVLKNDIDRLKSYYIRNGFLNSTIDYSLDTLRSRKLIDITVLISENDFVRIDTVLFKGTLDSLAYTVLDSIQMNIASRLNQRFRDEDVFNTENLLLHHFSNAGYPFVQTHYQVLLDQQRKWATLIYDIEPGKRSFFGDINISGDTLIPESFISKRILFSKSDLYSQQQINKTQQNIFETELFQYVIINAIKDSVMDNNIPIEIYVKELPRYALEGGVGYGTEDRIRLSGQITRLSFLGGARRLVLKAKTSYWTPFSVGLSFIQPDLFVKNLDFSLNPFFEREREESYQIDRVGGGINFLYQLNKKTKLTLTYAVERDNLHELTDLELDEDELEYNKSILSLGRVYNSTNNKFYPTKGYILDGSVSYAGLGFGSDIQYYQFQFSLRNYLALSQNLNLALRFKTGVIQYVLNSDETPVEDRFYAGGASSLRGWSRHDISPVNEEGYAIGGNSLAEISSELRFPIYDIFGGVVFLDAGNVWSDAYQFSPASLHYDAGIGFRVKSPIGPIRLDMASPIIKDSFDFQFFISIGQTF